jgi:nondiscriminating glutamyl-tRNA synthetase
MPETRTRFAPSPTGGLHIGGARTALFNWLFARRQGGKFILRSEDTDALRSSRAHEESILADLKWLGLEWDEGPDAGGPFGPYRQSERKKIYADTAERLLSVGQAYYCSCTKERLEELRGSQISAGVAPRYDQKCLKTPPAGTGGAAIRFRVPERILVFVDGLHGKMSFKTADIGDFVIMGSDGLPSYNFAAAVDDALMEITEVIRGDDHLSNTPRQLMIFDAIEKIPPIYTHVPLIVGADQKPLSKREGGSMVAELRGAGFHPLAVVNALARLGWAPGTEDLLDEERLCLNFQIKRLSKSPARFDMDALRRYEKLYLKQMGTEEILSEVMGEFQDLDLKWLVRVVEELKTEVSSTSEFKDAIRMLAGEVAPADDAAALLKNGHSMVIVKAMLKEVEKYDAFDAGFFKDAVKRLSFGMGEPVNVIMLPIRAALTGKTSGMDMSKLAGLMARTKVIERLTKHI